MIFIQTGREEHADIKFPLLRINVFVAGSNRLSLEGEKLSKFKCQTRITVTDTVAYV